jgi:hypothetical protein
MCWAAVKTAILWPRQRASICADGEADESKALIRVFVSSTIRTRLSHCVALLLLAHALADFTYTTGHTCYCTCFKIFVAGLCSNRTRLG